MDIVKIPSEFDSKFRFILVAAQRAKQLLNGAPPKVRVKAKKPTVIAIQEVAQSVIKFEILETPKEEAAALEEEEEESE
ncbi:MAG: DNA-directed RNA polymerase subunit omega [Acidobacteriota bacterium]